MVLQIVIITGVLCFFGLIVFFIRKNSITMKYALLWFFAVFVMLIVSIFPDTLAYIANVFGFVLFSNAVFSLLFGFVIVILLSLTSIVSKQTERIKTLVQMIALLEKRIRELEEKK